MAGDHAFAAVDELFVSYAAEKRVPGMAMGIVQNGRLVHTLYHGCAQVPAHGHVFSDDSARWPDARGRSLAVTERTRFRIASMTKSFTALAVLTLRDAGKLQLDSPLDDVLPAHRALWSRLRLTADAPQLTVRHLLEMTVGLPQDDPYADRLLHLNETDFAALIDTLGGAALSRSPGQCWEYTNLTYGMLALVVSAAAGVPFHDYITAHVLQPLGMHDTHWDYADIPDEQCARGYRSVRRRDHDAHQHHVWLEEERLHHGVLGAMGGLWTTVADFARYICLHLGAWPARDDPDHASPVRRATLREMHSPHNFAQFKTTPEPLLECYSYGLRWCRQCGDADNAWWIRHGGGLPGFGSEWRALPEHGFGIVALTNLTYADVFELNGRAVALLRRQGVVPAPPPLPVPPALLQRQAELLAFLTQPDEPHPHLFAFNFFLDTPLPDWRRKIARKRQRIGDVQRVTDIAPENRLRGTFHLHGSAATLAVFFTLSPEAVPKVQHLRLTIIPLPTTDR